MEDLELGDEGRASNDAGTIELNASWSDNITPSGKSADGILRKRAQLWRPYFLLVKLGIGEQLCPDYVLWINF